MSNEAGEAASNRGALFVVQAVLNKLIEAGAVSRTEIVDSLSDVFSPSADRKPEVVVDDPVQTRAVLRSFVLGLATKA